MKNTSSAKNHNLFQSRLFFTFSLATAVIFCSSFLVQHYFADDFAETIPGTGWSFVPSLSWEEPANNAGIKTIAHVKGAPANNCLDDLVIVTSINGQEPQSANLTWAYVSTFFKSKSVGDKRLYEETVLGIKANVSQSETVAIIDLEYANPRLKSRSAISHMFTCAGKTPEEFETEVRSLVSQINDRTLPDALLAADNFAKSIIAQNPAPVTTPAATATTGAQVASTTTGDAAGENVGLEPAEETNPAVTAPTETTTETTQAPTTQPSVSDLQSKLDKAVRKTEVDSLANIGWAILKIIGVMAVLASIASIAYQIYLKSKKPELILPS